MLDQVTARRNEPTIADSNFHYGVIGGGVLGMTVAKRLAEAGHRVTLVEAADHLGGLADAWELGDTQWDRHYHVTLLSDHYTRQILSDLDLDDSMKWVVTKTGFYTDGKLYSMSNTWEFLTFSPLSLFSRLRLGFTIFYGSRIKNWKRLEKVSVADWLGRWSGKRTLEKIWIPLLRSKLGDNYTRTSAAFIWATIARLYAARRSGLKEELFGYLPGGYKRFHAAYEQQLRKLGVEIFLSTQVSRVSKNDTNGFSVTTTADQSHRFDQIVVTLPSALIPQICAGLSESEKRAHQQIEYQSLVCASLLLKRPLSQFYVTNITDPAPFTGVIEMTTMVPPSEFNGQTLVYLPKYVPMGDAVFDQSDKEIEEEFLSALERMYPDFTREDVMAFRLSRVRQVMAVSTLNYSDHLPPMQTSVEGLHVVNSAQIVNGTLNVNETIRLAEEAVDALKLHEKPADH